MYFWIKKNYDNLKCLEQFLSFLWLASPSKLGFILRSLSVKSVSVWREENASKFNDDLPIKEKNQYWTVYW